MKKRLMAMLLSAAMILTLLPTMALADDEPATLSGTVYKKEDSITGNNKYIVTASSSKKEYAIPADSSKSNGIVVEFTGVGNNYYTTDATGVVLTANDGSVSCIGENYKSYKSNGKIMLRRYVGWYYVVADYNYVGFDSREFSDEDQEKYSATLTFYKQYTASVTVEDKTATYDGTVVLPEVGSLSDTTNFEVKYKVGTGAWQTKSNATAANGFPVNYNAAPYEVTVGLFAKGGTTPLDTEEATVTITPATDTFAVTAKSGLVYNGEEQNLVEVTEPKAGTLTYTLNGEEWTEGGVPAATDPGDYTVYWKYEQTDKTNYKEVETITGEEIVTIAWPEKEERVTYGASATVEGGHYGVDDKWDVVFGTGAVDIDVSRLKDNANVTGTSVGKLILKHSYTNVYPPYNRHTEYFTVVVEPAELTDVSVVQAQPLTYERNKFLTAAIIKGATTVDGTTATFTYCTVEDGTYTEVLPGFATAGEHTVYYKVSAANHEDVLDRFTVVIAPKALTDDMVAAKNMVYKSDAYDQLTVEDGTALTEDDYAVTYYEYAEFTKGHCGSMTFADTGDAGAAPVDAGKYVAKVEATGNYTGTIYKQFEITPKSVTLTWQWDGAAFPVSITYDGKEHAVSATSSDFIQGDDVVSSVTCDTAKNAAAYTATATLTGEDAGNYTLSNGTQKFTINPKQQSSSSSSGSSTPTVTVPVTGKNDSVKVQASVSGSTATVKELKSTDAEKVAGGAIEIDLSGLNKAITAAKIPEKTVDEIADKGNLTVKLSTATVTFDAKATESISGQTAAGGLELKVETNTGSTAKLTAKQQEAIKGEEIDAQVVVNVSMLSGGKAVGSFNGGNATLKVPYTLKKDQSASGLCVYFIGSSGEVEKLPCFYVNGEVVFTVEHFSDYVIAYDAVAATVCPKDLTCLLSQFPDLRTTSWYHDGIHYCLEKGLMNGMPDGLFLPGGDTTRAQATSMLWRVMGSPAVNYELNFSDVRHGCWYEEAVRWATSEGIINGVNDTDFAPTDPVTREQFASMLYRLAQIKGEKFDGEWTLDFSDLARMRAWAHDAASWCNQKGIMAGLPDGTFQPRGNTTRAQAASMIQRFNEIILGK